MKVKELIEVLQQMDEDLEVATSDGYEVTGASVEWDNDDFCSIEVDS